MNKLSLIAIALCLTACGSQSFITTAAPTSADPFEQLIGAQASATAAAGQYSNVSAVATSRASATETYLLLSAQQTRVYLSNGATATAMTQNLQATRESAKVIGTQTALASESSAQATKASATQTARIAESNATAAAQSYQFTATAGAVNVQATQASASATSTAHAASANATAVSGNATATVVAEGVKTKIEQETYSRMTAGTIAWGGLIVGAGLVLLLAILIYRAIDVFIWRKRITFRDASGELVIFFPGDKRNAAMLRPGRMPSEGSVIADGTSTPLTIHAAPGSAPATRNDQRVSMLLAAKSSDAETDLKIDTGMNEGERLQLEPEQDRKPFEARPLELRPNRKMFLPVGVTGTAEEMWIPLNTVPHALVAGSSGMGKSTLMHAWIQALIAGRAVKLGMYDGKDGLEFERYAGTGAVALNDRNLGEFLKELTNEDAQRAEMFKPLGVRNLDDYNATGKNLPHVVLFIDEISRAMEVAGARERLEQLAERARATGIHLVMATQHPDTKTITQGILSNALLRIAFSVPHSVNSVAVLGCSGAEKLGGIPGRMLVNYHSKLIVAQAFAVKVPMPGEWNVSEMPPDIREMVNIAIGQGGGLFVVTQIARELNIRPAKVTDAARWLERNNLLTPVIKDGEGRNKGRRITPRLLGMVQPVTATGK